MVKRLQVSKPSDSANAAKSQGGNHVFNIAGNSAKEESNPLPRRDNVFLEVNDVE